MTPSEMIDKLGGTTAVAKLLNVKPPSVHAWRVGGIPDDKLIRLAPLIERATNGVVTRRELRPDDWQLIWPELVEVLAADDRRTLRERRRFAERRAAKRKADEQVSS